MKFTLLTTLLFAAVSSFAQTDSIEGRFATATQSTVITLNRTDIERLPATSFLELMAGAFPFLGAEGIEEEFTYVVNGFVQVNPNAINLSQLESVSFYPGGTPLTGGTLGKRGTFIINTKPTQNRFSVSTKTGLWSVKNDDLPASKFSGLHKGFFSLNEVSLQRKTEKAFLSGAVSYLHDKSPDYLYTSASETGTRSNSFNRLRASIFSGYQLSKKAEIEAGLFYTLQPQNLESKMASGTYATVQSANNKTAYTAAHVGFRFTPSSKFTNLLTAEVSRTKETQDGTSQNIATGFPTYFYNGKGDRSFTAFAFSNRMAWTPVNTPALNIQASLLARYRLYKYSEQYATTQSQGTGVPVAFYGSAQKTASHSFSLSPSLTACFREWLFVQAGFAYDDYQASLNKNTARKILPDAGIKLDLAPFAKSSGFTTLALSSNYHQYVRAAERGDLLETNYIGSFYPTGFVIGIADSAYTPRKNWTTALAIGLLQNRLMAKISYRLIDRTLWTAVPYSIGTGTSYAFLFEPLSSKGWSVELKAAVIEKESVKWNTQFVFYKEQYRRRQYGFGLYSQLIDPVLFDAGKAPWRGGFRTMLDVHRFFLQASLLLSFNEQGTADSGAAVDDMTKFNTNFLLAGYRLPVKGKALKGFEVNLQSRNLFSTKHDLAARYTGIGLSASF